ncbi:hypothetical protein OIU77_014115 [Salix suchowensis]|uniref:HMA domain-containing protein n=1 Tax=Salix suchowensis TaxID=1278906 RepID=A0ABQ8ZX00_9ROSI|nr:hypothetical protein OIU77_014115 [Salix suchowensis]KAJ6356911.1 hypothetical protein OIU78_004912 [Salix suchowensis]
MALATGPKKEIQRIGIKKSKNMLYSGTSLASAESLTVPLVQEVVLSADIRCAECQKRVADIMSRMNETESVSINVLEKKVTLTCRYPGVRVSTRQVAASLVSNLKEKQKGQANMFKVASILHNTNLCKQERDASFNVPWSKTKHRSEARDNRPNVPNKTPSLSSSRIRFQNERKGFPADIPKAENTTCCAVLRINLDCNACCRKARRIILNMKEVETHMIEKQQCRISVCGRFRPSDVAIKLRKKMNRRVEIMDTQEFASSNEQEDPPP